MQIFNNKSQKNEEATFSVDGNGELVATFKDGGFLKFPSGTSKADLTKLAKEHERANKDKEVISPEQEAENEKKLKATQKLVAQLNGDTTSESDTTQDEDRTV